MSKKHEKVWMTLHYVEQLLILVSAITRCFSCSGFAFLAGIPTDIATSTVGWRLSTIITGIKQIIH